ncbi:uncharacterized protein DUF4268 [Asanoa ferruginea]|uniref:Uncharacterized protein DUF4268 n=2 Tax=Asanoa ferruginea TaxID=53367 RepID=A0A3D9ZJF5_9ACTN|nr:uncharacterized protein DUF4268 [Asanoa ferruginea]
MQLTSLQPVTVTTVWPTEAHHFTPWLLANSALLSQTLGMDVELEAREYKVGKFSLDLIGREVATDTPVIVENQYGPTDHSHLGQILTYAGGTKPTTIIWVAESFREEHRAALEWLNTHTEPGIRFFGIRITAVTLAGAPAGLVAPLLELVVKPNDWEKLAVAATQSGAAAHTPAQALYLEFWSQFEPSAKQHGWTSGAAPAANWWSMPSGVSGASWTVSWATFGGRSEIYFGHPDPAVNLTRWQLLDHLRDQITAAYGDELFFDALPEKKGCRIEARRTGPKITDRNAWPDMLTWLVDSQTRLRTAIASVGGVPNTVSAPLPADDVDAER